MQTYGNLPLCDPNLTYAACVRLGLPTWWRDLGPNSFTNVLGCRSGSGFILLPRAALDALDLNAVQQVAPDDYSAGHDLTLSVDESEVSGAEPSSITYKNLHVVCARNLTPGLDGDPASAYLVELADRRRFYRLFPFDLANLVASSSHSYAFNLRKPCDGTDYYELTLYGGATLWTWEQMTEVIWNNVFDADFPGLPFSPDGDPDCLDFQGWYAMDALECVLDRIGCALAWDGTTDTFSIVRIGAADAAADLALAANGPLRVLDSDFIEPPLGRIPGKVRVLFPKSGQTADDDGSSYAEIDVADPYTDGSAVDDEWANTCHILYDDLRAVYTFSGTTLTNGPALTARAAERAADHFRRLRVDRRRATYGMPLPDVGLQPGSQVKAVRHGDRGRGAVTEIGGFPGMASGDPFAVGGGMGPGGDPFSAGARGQTNEAAPYGFGEPSYWVRGGGPHWLSQQPTNPMQVFAYYEWFRGCDAITTVDWADVTGTPTTGTGYGISTIDAIPIGLTTPAAGKFTDLEVTGHLLVSGNTLRLYDADDSHYMAIVLGTNLANNRTLTITTGDANRTLTLSGDTALGGGSHSGTNTGDQNLSSYAVGPSSATDNALVRFDSTTGKLVQNGVATEDDSGNLTALNHVPGYTTTTTAAGTTTLTVASTQLQFFTGSSIQNCKLPVTSTLTLGHSFVVVNDNASVGAVTVQSSGSNTIAVVSPGNRVVVVCILTSGTTAASWSVIDFGAREATGAGAAVFAGSPILSAPEFTGVPLAPTASPGTNTTQIATTAFVLANGGARTEGTLASAGSTQGDAAAIVTSGAVTVSGADGTKGVILPDVAAAIVCIKNEVVPSALKVYPHSGASIGSGFPNAADSLAGDANAIYYRVSSTHWYKV